MRDSHGARVDAVASSWVASSSSAPSSVGSEPTGISAGDDEQLAMTSRTRSPRVRVNAQSCSWSGSSSSNRPSRTTSSACRSRISRWKWANTDPGSRRAASALIAR